MRSITANRQREALFSDLGPIIGQAPGDLRVVEIMVKPNGKF